MTPGLKATRMHLLELLILLMSTLMMKTAAQSPCDPLTQYESEGQCCKMCGPGTSMSVAVCLTPQCTACGENEYQDKYTQESKCQLQPYCDPNRNFERPVHNRKKKSICMCKQAFHCSSQRCEVCVPHQRCEPGYGAAVIGNHTHDTVCEKCPEGTYSDEHSWNGTCKPLTKCQVGYRIKQHGTDRLDNVCEILSRTHIYVACTLAALIVVAIIAVGIKRYKAKQANATDKVKACLEACMGEKQETEREDSLLTTPAHPAEDESLSIGRSMQYPEENDDERFTEISDIGFTDNGNVVKQENGKAETLSRQESQTQTSTERV